MTTFEQFCALARSHPGALVPVWRDCLLDADTAVHAFAKIRRGPFAFLLESAPAGSETWARYTFMGTEPRGAWRLTDGVVETWTPAGGWAAAHRPEDPLAELQKLLAEEPAADVRELGPFWTGAVGFLAYDAVRYIEAVKMQATRGVHAPDAVFVFTRSLVIVDNFTAHARVVIAVPVPAAVRDDEMRTLFDQAVREREEIVARLHGPAVLAPLELDASAAPAVGRSTIARADFERGVERIKEYIRAGDCFQALLARRIVVKHDFDSTSLYRALRALNPSPYMYHLVLDGVELVGSSPELLVRVGDGKVTVRPIAGTRRRGATAADDERLAAELLADEKERAEHVMLVDLGRNDVGRIAEYGTVRVSDLMTVERYSHVLHIVSQVDGDLPPDASAVDVFRATFPAGTMTGAPKIRAMEIIAELEPERRGPYAGAVGYIASGDRRMDLAITIRTCVIADGEASVQAGAGIVADSVAATEWEETETKARALLVAIGRARAGTPIANR